mmetsp:Transcript_32802/g.50081  ORF Transcript_32802/g.50081 Transcript_32802/m.50081 type:complete len:174 (+) Transcript_32802:2576-3097(+)
MCGLRNTMPQAKSQAFAIKTSLDHADHIYESRCKPSKRLSIDIKPSKLFKILIVDDQLFNIEALKSLLVFKLKVDPDQVLEAMNGEEALDTFIQKKDAIKLIFMDCNMPFMDGYESTQRIREYASTLGDGNQPLIVAVTAHVEADYLARCYTCGMNSVLRKPVKITEISKAIN